MAVIHGRLPTVRVLVATRYQCRCGFLKRTSLNNSLVSGVVGGDAKVIKFEQISSLRDKFSLLFQAETKCTYGTKDCLPS